MTNEKVPPVPIFELASFVDATTVVIVGPRVDELREGEELYVLGIGTAKIPKANVPLVSAKTKLEVTFPAGPYALARPPAYTETVPSSLSLMNLMIEGSARRTVRTPLTSDEKLFVGDPGKLPVKIGDIVIRKADLTAFIRYHAESEASKTA